MGSSQKAGEALVDCNFHLHWPYVLLEFTTQEVWYYGMHFHLDSRYKNAGEDSSLMYVYNIFYFCGKDDIHHIAEVKCIYIQIIIHIVED